MFESTGHLAPGFHNHSLQGLRNVFVENLPDKNHRQVIYQSFEGLLDVMLKAKVSAQHWIGGSFVSIKQKPSDIDLVCLCDPAQINAIPPDVENEFTTLFKESLYLNHERTCDAYLVVRGHEKHPKEKQFRTIYDYWQFELGHTKDGIPVGIVQLDDEPKIPPPPTPDQKKQGVTDPKGGA